MDSLDRYAWSMGLMKSEPSGLTDDALMSSQEGDCARRSAHPVYIGIEQFEDDEDVLAVLTDYRPVNSSTYLSPPRRLR
jgi:hypothetical protein